MLNNFHRLQLVFFFLSTIQLFCVQGALAKALLELRPGETSFEYGQRIKKKIDEIVNIPSESYLDRVDDYRGIMEKFIIYKKGICSGEFSTMVLNASGVKDFKGRKLLGREEKKLCYREIKALQLTFINHMFLARRAYLVFLHKKEMAELENAKNKALKSLRYKFDPKQKRKK